MQNPPFWPEYPALHVHRVRALLPVAEFESAGQDEHASVPGVALNAPGKHDVHGPPSGPEEPAGHCTEHSIDAVLPGVEVFPRRQSSHVSMLLAPFAAEYVPDGQSVQELAASPYLPAGHLSQLHGPHSHEIAYPCRHTQSSLETLAKGEAEFAGHPVHASEVVDRASGLKVLAPHASHALLLMVFLYVPAVHSVHVPTLDPENPA